MNIRHINTQCLHMVLCYYFSQWSMFTDGIQMVNIHADGQVLTDEFLMCRLLPVSIRIQGHPMVFGPEMVSGHLDKNIRPTPMA